MNRRHEHRFPDGAETDIQRLRDGACLGRIVDVSTCGLRLWTPEPLTPGELVSCRVQFDRRGDNLPVRVLWSRADESGYICGAVYDPLFPNAARLIDAYWLFLGYRRERGWDVQWAC